MKPITESRCTRHLQTLNVPYPRTCQECGLGPCRYAKAEAVEAPRKSIEEQFIDRDRFVSYVEREVNPVRASNGLSVITSGAASHLYDVLTSGRYRFTSPAKEGE